MNYKSYRNGKNKYLYFTDTEQYPIHYIKHGYKGYVHVLYSEIEDKFLINEVKFDNLQNDRQQRKEFKTIFNGTGFNQMIDFFPKETHEVIKEFELERLMKLRDTYKNEINPFYKKDFEEKIDKEIEDVKNDTVKKYDDELFIDLTQ